MVGENHLLLTCRARASVMVELPATRVECNHHRKGIIFFFYFCGLFESSVLMLRTVLDKDTGVVYLSTAVLSCFKFSKSYYLDIDY